MKKLLICFFLLTLLMITSCSNGISSSTSSTTSIPVDQQEMEKKYEGFLKDKKIYIANIGLNNSFKMDSKLIKLGILNEKIIYKDHNSDATKEKLLRASEVEPGAIVIIVFHVLGSSLADLNTSIREEVERGKEFLALKDKNIILNFSFHRSYLNDNNKYEISKNDLFNSLQLIEGINLYLFVNDKNRINDTPALGTYVQHMVKAYNPNLNYLQYDGTKHLEEVFLPLLVKGIGE